MPSKYIRKNKPDKLITEASSDYARERILLVREQAKAKAEAEGIKLERRGAKKGGKRVNKVPPKPRKSLEQKLIEQINQMVGVQDDVQSDESLTEPVPEQVKCEPAAEIEQVEARCVYPAHWVPGQLLNVRNYGGDYVVTLMGEEIGDDNTMKFNNTFDCQEFVSKWYARLI